MRKKEITKYLEKALDYARMERAYFGDDTARIIELTKTFREANIIYHIELAIELVKSTNSKVTIERVIRDAMQGSTFEDFTMGDSTQQIIKVTRPYRETWIWYNLLEALRSLKGGRRE